MKRALELLHTIEPDELRLSWVDAIWASGTELYTMVYAVTRSMRSSSTTDSVSEYVIAGRFRQAILQRLDRHGVHQVQRLRTAEIKIFEVFDASQKAARYISVEEERK